MNFKFKIGLKLYSTNTDLIPEAVLLKNKFFAFIELYIIPGSYEKTISVWKELDVPYIIHAPHSFHGINIAQESKRIANRYHFKESQMFADRLGSEIIIVHGGNNGTIEETILQIKSFNDVRIIVENKPKIGIMDEDCVGWSPGEFKYMEAEGILSGFALDFTHAACAACSQKISAMGIINDLIAFHPKVYHLSDGDISSEKDKHYNLGKGNFNLHKFLSVIPDGAMVTLETPRKPASGLEDFINDVIYLQNLIMAPEAK